jgi:hypothetical protein
MADKNMRTVYTDVDGTAYVECSWCGGDTDADTDDPGFGLFLNQLGESFCCKGHRSASNRALCRLTGMTMAELVRRREANPVDVLGSRYHPNPTNPGAREWQAFYAGQIVTRRVVGEQELRGRPVVLIAVVDATGKTGVIADIIPTDELEAEIAGDTKRLASNREAAQRQEQERKDKAEALHLQGFEDTLPSGKARARAVDVLNQVVSVRREFDKRKHHIERLVKEGFRVQDHPRFKRVLSHPGGTFFTQKDLTKLALDYAEFLSGRRENNPGTPSTSAGLVSGPSATDLLQRLKF